MEVKDGGPAFPTLYKVESYDYDEDHGKFKEILIPMGGMTLRDYFASKALPSFIDQEAINYELWPTVANFAYKIADAMIEERSK